MVKNFKRLYQKLFVLVGLVPLFLLVPSLVEGIQHLIEWYVGMFASESGFKAAGTSALRSGTAMFKIATILGTALVVGRFWLHDQSVRRALTFRRRELLFLAAGVTVVGLLAAAVLFLGPTLQKAAASVGGAGLADVAPFVPLIAFALVVAWQEWVATWWLREVMGDPEQSKARIKSESTSPSRWANVAGLAALAALVVLHYVLNYKAVGLTGEWLAVVLVVDSLLVGVLAVLMGNLLWFVYRQSIPKGTAP